MLNKFRSSSKHILEDKYCSICHKFMDKDKKSSISFCCSRCLELINLNLIMDSSSSCKNKDIDIDINTDKPIVKKLIPVSSLYIYQNMIRDLILRVKIQKDLVALTIIKELFLKYIDKNNILNKTSFDKIIPVPSSLWSRIRGKFDIAYFLANELSSYLGIPLEPPPIGLGWNLIKRSKNKNKNKYKDKDRSDNKTCTSILMNQNTASNTKEKSILIIDDIVTTGDTLKKIASYYVKDNIHCISFSKSYGFTDYIELY